MQYFLNKKIFLFYIQNLFPNPAKTEINIELISPVAEPAEIMITNGIGVATTKMTQYLAKGNNNIHIPLNHAVGNGLYLITIQSESGQRAERKFMVLR